MALKPFAPHPLPEIPAGHDFAKDTFWYQYRRRFTWHTEERAMEWYNRESKVATRYGRDFPPKAVSCRAYPVPQVWDGKDEKAGRVPKTGKI